MVTLKLLAMSGIVGSGMLCAGPNGAPPPSAAATVEAAAQAAPQAAASATLLSPWTYRRPYGPRAPWNVTVRGLPRHPDSGVFVDRLWAGSALRPGNFRLTFDGFTYPVYYVDQAAGLYPVRTTWETNIDGGTIPWHPAWRPSDSADAQVIIVDRANGREWNLFEATFNGTTVFATNGNLVQEGTGFGDGSRPASVWSKENGFRPSRGIGIQYLAMLVRPEEIMAGRIPHALSMAVPNTDGDVFVAPATKLEHDDHPAHQVPEGMRFALDVTDAEIDAWVNSLSDRLPPVARRSARTIAVALRDYGWFITDTSGTAHLQFENRLTAGAAWSALGLDEATWGGRELLRNLLDGLIQKDRIYALVPSDQYPSGLRAASERQH